MAAWEVRIILRVPLQWKRPLRVGTTHRAAGR